jgi:hypothetical protein
MFIQSRAFAVFTFNWNGLISTAWTTTANWTVTGTSPDGTLPNYPGSNSRTSDIVQFGVATLALYLFQPTLSGQSLTVASITFGPKQYISSASLFTGTILTVNNVTLNVTGNIVQNINTGNGSGTTVNDFLKGTGTINCANVQVGSGTAVTGSNNYLFSEIKNLNVTSNVTIDINTQIPNGSGFRLQDGNMSIGGQILFIKNTGISASNAGFFTINGKSSAGIKSSAILTLSNDNAIGTPPAQSGGLNVATINFNGTSVSDPGFNPLVTYDGTIGGKSTVIYTGANPTIYTTSTKGFGTGGGTINTAISQYDNLTIQTNGVATIGSGTGVLRIDSIFTTKAGIVSTGAISFATNNTTVIIGRGFQTYTPGKWINNTIVNGGAGSIDLNGSLDNSGTMSMNSGTINIAGDYTNSSIFTPGTGLITFDGKSAQSLTDNTSAGTKFNDVTFRDPGIKTMNAGSNFSVAPTYTLNADSSATLTVSNTPATYTSALTMLSTLAGDASIGDLSAGSITGSINVQRFVKGGLRRYMLLSSPVANTSASTYDLKPLKVNTWITGPNGSAIGYDFDNAPQTGNSPSVFIYDENSPTSTNVNSVINNEYKPFQTMSEKVPIGNGFLFYFRGNRAVVNPFSPPFPAANDATLNFFGAVYKGAGTNGSFNAQIINFSNSPIPTYYTTLAGGNNLSWNSTVSTKKGFNMIGNPYASTIDLKKVYSVNKLVNTNYNYKFFYMLIKDAQTGPNSSSTRFAVYDALADTVQAGASQYALSGQGFFIQTAGATPITFNETMKVAYSFYTSRPSTKPIFNVIHNPRSASATLAVNPYENNIQRALASSAAIEEVNAPMPQLRMELMKDSTILNTTDINFDKNSGSTFKIGEDAPYIASSGQGDFFYSQSADSVGCFINYTSDLEKLKRVNLVVTFSNYGLYKITSPYKANIDERYTIFLKDKFTNDSLDVVHNPEYSFNVTTDKASFAHDRFYLSIGIAPGHEYKLLDFNGAKVTAGIQLTWKTDNESNFTKFAVEKSTNGGKSFTAIDSLLSTGEGVYTFTDKAVGTGQVTYRLMQTLVTGNTDISKNLTFNYQDSRFLKFIVYPTNAAQNININFGKTYSNRVKVNIVSSTGSMIKTITASNTDSVQQDVGNLLKGIYIVDAIDEATGKRIGSAKFFKQ